MKFVFYNSDPSMSRSKMLRRRQARIQVRLVTHAQTAKVLRTE